MQKPTIIPHHIIESGHAFFEHAQMMKAQRIIEFGRINISFSKERENRFIVSGIVSESEPFQVKIQGQDKNLSSNCNCNNWDEEHHCPHAAALFIHYSLSQNYVNEKQSDQLKSQVMFHGHGVHVENYGNIVMILPKKSLGQNFLIDPHITEKILKITNIENKNIIEIGPGRGALTEAILKKKT